MSNAISPSPLIAGLVSDSAVTAEIRNYRGRASLSDEKNIPQGFSVKRREEFVAGRMCANEALRRFGLPLSQVGREASGAPIWPAGVLGSITHTNAIAAAVIAPASEFKAVGLDIEEVGAVDVNLWPLLFSEPETLRLGEAAPFARTCLATALFAAKEAFYKAQWPLTREWVDFLDVEVELSDRAFSIRPLSSKAWTQYLHEPEGRWIQSGEVIAATVLISDRG
jgi:4'-phosphopantetheinyl transferase EntD